MASTTDGRTTLRPVGNLQTLAKQMASLAQNMDGRNKTNSDDINQAICCSSAILAWMEFDGSLTADCAQTLERIPLLDIIVPAIRSFHDPQNRSLVPGLADVLVLLEQVDWEALNNNGRCDHSGAESWLLLYEQFLHTYSPTRRRAYGVFYTPEPIVSFTVRSVDERLRTDFGLEDGLADTSTWGQVCDRHADLQIPMAADKQMPFVQIVEPAMGSGAFLVEVIEQVWQTMLARWRREGHDAIQCRQLWNAYVARDLLPRLHGIELLQTPWLLAHLHTAHKLAQTGYDFHSDHWVNFMLANSLEPQLYQSAEMPPLTVVLGNPPFSGVSDNTNAWIDGLLHGKDEHGPFGNYYEVDCKPLGEKKVWLQDDYVKFIRLAHWMIEQSGTGIIGFVTNHGYLDNPTFRGMRDSLLKTFSAIRVLDLHGNTKKQEYRIHPQGDGSVFDIAQGIAVGIFSRCPMKSKQNVLRADLWGRRTDKLAAIGGRSFDELTSEKVVPKTPNYFFHPVDDARQEEYEHGLRICDVMRVNSTAVVTARDRFVIALSEQELTERMERFCDPAIDDGTLRREYFNRSRSKKYAPGDTRSWKLPAARERAMEDSDFHQHIGHCLYRPFDRRPIFWAPWMIDWTRPIVSQHMLAGPNLALVVRRQMLPGQECNFFWISQDVVIDGAIRSDNRGSESMLPLYLYDGNTRQANLDPNLIDLLSKQLSLTWIADGAGDLQQTFGPEDVIYFIYATFFSSQYRERYAEQLRIDFPRVFLPTSLDLFGQISECGRRLADAHLMRDKTTDEQLPSLLGDGPPLIKTGYPQFRDDTVWINDTHYFDSVSEDIWAYRAGAHQVCHKWLKDRSGRQLTEGEVTIYQNLVHGVGQTLLLQTQIDQIVTDRGGWENAFCCEDSGKRP